MLICADCVPFAMGNFHPRLLGGKTLAIACPKLDQTAPYIDKLARIFSGNEIESLTVARMEVPCCAGLTRLVQEAVKQCGQDDLKIDEVVVSVGGDLLT